MRSFFYHPPILADAAVPGATRDFSYCFKIINLEDYPNYLFFTTIKDITEIDYQDYKKNIGGEYISINSNRCIEISGNYRPVAIVWAIPKEQYIPDTLTQHKAKLIKVSPYIHHPVAIFALHKNKLIADSYKIDQLTSEGFVMSMIDRSQPINLNIIIFPLLGLAIIIAIIIWIIREWKENTE